MSIDDAPTSFESAGFVLARRVGKGTEYLLMQSAAAHGSWGFPKGTLEAGESHEQGAWRELNEETGLQRDDVRLYDGIAETISYTVPANVWGPGEPPVPTPKRATYYLARLVDDSREIAASDEHRKVAWLPLDEALKRLAQIPQLAQLLVRMAAKVDGSKDEREA